MYFRLGIYVDLLSSLHSEASLFARLAVQDETGPCDGEGDFNRSCCLYSEVLISNIAHPNITCNTWTKLSKVKL